MCKRLSVMAYLSRAGFEGLLGLVWIPIRSGYKPRRITRTRNAKVKNSRSRQSTGITGLDEVLGGGLPSNRLYVLEGKPGSGKTTLALQFLREGVRLGQRTLYITLSETVEELNDVAASHGWTLEGIDLLELNTLSERLTEEANYTVFHLRMWNWERPSSAFGQKLSGGARSG